jgi:hypothetical protein
MKGLDYFKSLFSDRVAGDLLIYDGSIEQSGTRSILNYKTFSPIIAEYIQ